MTASPSEVRERLDHPIIDADGHCVEFLPALLPYFHKEGVEGDGEALFQRILDPGTGFWSALSPAERENRRAVRPPWWAVPSRNTRDFATASMPALLHERMPELGLDFSVVYPSLGLVLPDIADEMLRRKCCRAVNRFHADIFAGLEDRLTPAAVVPMGSPEEAIEALEHAVQELGLKAVMIASFARRPVAATAALGEAVHHQASWVDSFAVDSPYDYDPFWARCIELGVSPAAHSGAFGWDGRRSISNYMYNHMGHFAAAGEALCKALFLGGVTRRFPSLRVAFLEGGVSWAARLLTALVGHWEKRNSKDLENYNPAHFDRALFGELLERHGGVLREMTAGPDIHELGFGAPQGQAEPDDEFGACGIRCPEDIRDRFVPNFHFGCEADDPLAHHAWDERGLPCQAKLSALFGSDIGHWDVPDMRKVLAEAWEQVEEGRMDAAQFRAFSFENVARFYTDSNPDFFAGTAVESEVQALLSSS